MKVTSGVLGLALLAGLVAGPVQAARQTPALSATPASGAAPLNVLFDGRGDGAAWFGGVMLEFGDGQSAPFCMPGQGCGAKTVTHRYERAGTYTARLRGNGEGNGRVLATVTVKVGS